LKVENVKQKINGLVYFLLTFVEPFETLFTDFVALEVRPRLGEDRRDEETLLEDVLEEEGVRLLFVKLDEVLEEDEEGEDTCPLEKLCEEDLYEDEVLYEDFDLYVDSDLYDEDDLYDGEDLSDREDL
jgi:hypothetical protein